MADDPKPIDKGTENRLRNPPTTRIPSAPLGTLGPDVALDAKADQDAKDAEELNKDPALEAKSFGDKAPEDADAPVKRVSTAVNPIGTLEESVRVSWEKICDEFVQASEKGKEAVSKLADAFKANTQQMLGAVVNTTHLGGAGGFGRGPLRGPAPPAGAHVVQPDNDTARELVDKTGMAPHHANSLTAPGANV